jgi:hypothetical protein
MMPKMDRIPTLLFASVTPSKRITAAIIRACNSGIGRVKCANP